MIEIKGEWLATNEGWVYEAVALTRTHRVVARARAHLSYSVGFSFEAIHGQLGRELVEADTRQLCRTLIPEEESTRAGGIAPDQ